MGDVSDGLGAGGTGSSLRPGSGTAVVVLVASAGGLGPLTSVLKTFPPDFPAAVVVAQHLAGRGSALVEVMKRRVRLPVSWATDGMVLQRGKVVIAPPLSALEVLPDGTVSLRPSANSALSGPLDALLTSLADSFGARVAAAVLSGMGRDSALGARALKDAGATVIAQSEESAEHSSMPLAAVESGAVDLVLDVRDIGPVLVDVVRGGELPRGRADRATAEVLFTGPGEVAALMRDLDWRRTRLGPVDTWPEALTSAAQIALACPVPMCVLWGPHLLQLYNDAYRLVLGAEHTGGLGQPNRESWPEVWHLNDPVYARVLGGEAVSLVDALYPISREGVPEDAWFDLTLSPIRDRNGVVDGALTTVIEKTGEVLSRRRLQLLNRLATGPAGAPTRRVSLERSLAALAGGEQDVPFALAYLVDELRATAELAGVTGVVAGGPMSPHTISLLDEDAVWPIGRVVRTDHPVTSGGLATAFPGVTVGRDEHSPGTAMIFALREHRDTETTIGGVVVLGINPRLPLTAAYREFLGLVAVQVAASLVDAGGRQRQRERIDRLAELDRVKTEFLSNISHELRTPLTLLMAPLEALAAEDSGLATRLRTEVEVASRNARRLLVMVETLLDFSQIEAGRLRTRLEQVDLAALTVGVVSAFQGAAKRAGIRLRVDCPPMRAPMIVDPAMWEKIVANLLSNALKFTFDGEITVELKELPEHAQLVVTDTGVGIPEEQLPHIFKRFHRVRDSKARTHEGTGIGLALVEQLTRQHRGRVRVQSRVGKGSRFTIWLPKRQSRRTVPAAQGAERRLPVAGALAEVASFWDTPTTAGDSTPPTVAGRPGQARILVIDDNQDMRDYLTRLLSEAWLVEAVGTGEQAMHAARHRTPDLILTDVMMPNIDGLRLLRQLRAESTLRHLPMIMLSARAGEQAAIEGLTAGANDYLVKPFAARELIARVGAQLELARVRDEADRRYRALVNASFGVVYRMNPDWSEMRALDGRGFIADTSEPSADWLDTYIHPDDQPRVTEAIATAVRDRTPFRLHHRVRRPNGSLGWTVSQAVPLLDDSGEIIEWVGTATEAPPPS
ncbi:chemotaxis protein CheB [Actinoplanes aureus]|uniref:histidine kinase n=1 Tax=Actinoplanes aureus TaxID=2792083 RepID=A0A931CIH1_9ACTN|nr:chemotaxis protein CheB [Actinoplanes aureus]MBG0566778.1 response regulator [Actinoplanes aureus]